MTHQVAEGDQLQDFAFVPYEDVMGVGSSGGVSTILVPGVGAVCAVCYIVDETWRASPCLKCGFMCGFLCSHTYAFGLIAVVFSVRLQ